MDLVVRATIVRRRRQMLVHSCMYYMLDEALIDDHKWQAWAFDLAELQRRFGYQAGFHDEAFKDWDGSTGFHLPYYHPDIVATAVRLLENAPQQSRKLQSAVNKFTIESHQSEKPMSTLVLNPLPDQVTGQTSQPTEPENPVLTLVKKLVDAGDTKLELLTKVYLQMRDKKTELETAAKAKVSPLSQAIDMLENHFLARFQTLGVDNVKTEHGTPYISKKTSYSVADATAFWNFVLEGSLAGLNLPPATKQGIINAMMQSGALALMESRAAKSAVEQYIAAETERLQSETGDEHARGAVPAGLNYTSVNTINVKKA